MYLRNNFQRRKWNSQHFKGAIVPHKENWATDFNLKGLTGSLLAFLLPLELIKPKCCFLLWKLLSNNSSKRDWINSHLFIPLTSTINRMKVAIKRHDYRGYVTRLVIYLPHSEVKSLRIRWQIQLHENTWPLASLRQRNNRLLFSAYRSHETQRHQFKKIIITK